MADTDYISVRRLRTFLAQMKQWVLGFTANRNTQAMSDVTKDTGISGTVAIGKSITIHTASGAQTANVMNADMIVDEKPTTNKDLASKAPTINLVDSMVMEAVSDAFDDITTIEYQSVNNVGKLPQVGQAGVIYLCSVWEEVENPTGNPHDLGYYVYTNGEYVLTTDTSVQSGTTYYTKAMATDEYIWLASESRYEPLGQAKVDLTGLLFAGSATSGGTAYKAAAIPFGRVDSTSTDTVFTASVDGITALEDGVCVLLQNGVVASASGFTININNLGAHPCFNNMTAATRDTTIFAKDYTMLMIYDATRVVGGITGAWCCYRGYDANTNTIGYQVRTNSATLPSKFKTYRYRLYFTSADGTHWVGANASTSTNATSSRTPTSEKINPFGPIIYYSTNGTTNASANLTATAIWQQYIVTLGYSFNHTGAALVLEYPKPVYLKCTPQSDGSVKIAGSSTVASYVQELPTTEDGFVYIFLGIAYAATTMELRLEHPVYYFKDGEIRLWTNQAAAEVEIKKYNSDKTDESEGTADYGQTDVVINGDVSTIVTTQAPPSAVRQYIAPSWRAMNQKLAEKADADDVPHNLHVTLTSSTSGNVTTYTADHTHAEITAALATGGIVDVEHESYLYDFDGDVDGEIYFRRVTTQSVSGGASDNVYEHLFLVRVVNDEDKWTKESDNPIISNASTSRTGVVQLNDAVNSNSTTQAATANAVKKVKDAIPTKTSDLTNDSGFITGYTETDPVFTASAAHGITSSDISNWNSKTSNVGTITGITMNGASKGTSGVVDLGTVITAHQDISGKANKANQQIADEPAAEQHNSTYDATIAANIKIDTNSGSQSANVVQHDMVTGSITGTVNTDKTKIPTSAAVAKYVGDIAANKQDTISDLATIRSGASKGATAIQPTDIKDELDPGGNGEIPDSAAIAEYVEDAISDKVDKVTSTDNAVVRFNGTGGAIQNSGVTIDDSNNITAAKFVKSGGTASQFLKADGSVDTTSYATAASDNNKVPYGGVLMPTNPFGGKTLYVNSLDNAFSSADQKYYVTVTKHNKSVNGVTYPYVDSTKEATADDYYVDSPIVSTYSTSVAHRLFDGNYESNITCSANEYIRIRIMFGENTSPSATTSYFLGYPYGTYYLSYYYNLIPNTASQCRVYNKFQTHGIGWHLYTATAFNGSLNNASLIERFIDNADYTRSCVDFIIFGNSVSGRNVGITQIDYQLSRPNIGRDGSTVTKYDPQSLYHTFKWYNEHEETVSINNNGEVTATKFKKSGGTSSQFLKADGSVDSTAYGTYSKPSGGIPKTDLASAVQTSLGKADTALQSHQDISGKVDKNIQSIADGTQHSTATDTTISALVTIGTQSGTQSANLVPHEAVTGNITGTPATDKNTIPTSAAVAQYVSTNSPAPTAGDGISISGSTISLKPATSSEIGGIVDADGESANNVYGVTIDPTTHIGLVPIPDATAQSNGILTKEDFATFSGKQDALTFDTAPTTNSVNPVISGGIKSALDDKADIDDLSGFLPKSSIATINGSRIDQGGNIVITAGSSSITTIDAVPTQNSQNPVQSGGVYTAINSLFAHVTEEEYNNLTELQKNNGTWYFIEE